MKKVFFVALMITMAATVGLAQFTKGTYLVGGSMNLNLGFDTYKHKSSGSTTTSSKITSFSLEPSAGYFFMDNLAAGAGLGLSTSSYKADGSSSKSKNSSITLSPFARYYFDKLYAQGAFEVGTSKTEFITDGGTPQTGKSGISGWSLLGGYAILLNESISLEPQIGYQSIGYKLDGGDKIIHSGLFLRLGVYVYISKK